MPPTLDGLGQHLDSDTVQRELSEVAVGHLQKVPAPVEFRDGDGVDVGASIADPKAETRFTRLSPPSREALRRRKIARWPIAKAPARCPTKIVT